MFSFLSLQAVGKDPFLLPPQSPVNPTPYILLEKRSPIGTVGDDEVEETPATSSLRTFRASC